MHGFDFFFVDYFVSKKFVSGGSLSDAKRTVNMMKNSQSTRKFMRKKHQIRRHQQSSESEQTVTMSSQHIRNYTLQQSNLNKNRPTEGISSLTSRIGAAHHQKTDSQPVESGGGELLVHQPNVAANFRSISAIYNKLRPNGLPNKKPSGHPSQQQQYANGGPSHQQLMVPKRK